jgi:hypothetical protein
MKSVKQLFKVLALIFLVGNFAYAQGEQPIMFSVHTDYVNFNKMTQYEEAAKQLKDECVKHDIKDANWMTVSAEDGRYMYVTPIKNMADLDKNTMSGLYEKMGEEEAGKMFKKMNECYDSHGDHIVYYIPELSYNPEGYSRDGMNEREYHFLYYSPQNGAALGEAMKGIKDLWAEKGVKYGYNVYHSGFGSDKGYFMVAIAGKNAMYFAETGEENDKLLGEDGQKALYDMIQLTYKYDQVNADIRPDLSYTPKE